MFLFGSFGDDPTIFTEAGLREWVFALSGDDMIYNVASDDHAYAGSGDDEIHLDDSLLSGSPGADYDRPIIFGGPGNDSVEYNSKDEGTVESRLFGLVKILTMPGSGKTVLMIGVETVDADFLG